jgi:hypothetical protein
MPWLVLFLVLAWVTYDGDGNPVDGVMDTLARITRGERLTRAPYDPDTGVVPGTPDDLASEANLTSDQYALARMLSSEEGNSDNLIKAAVCWATINWAAKQGQTITQLLTHAQTAGHSGMFGTFKDIEEGTALYDKADRYASTALDPYDGDGQIASGCLDGSIPDPTSGATHFDRPGGEKHPDTIAANRAKEGFSAVDVPGIDPTVIRFWA